MSPDNSNTVSVIVHVQVAQVAQAMWLAGVHLEQYCNCFVFICIPYCLYSGGDTFREEVEMMIWS